MTKNNKKGFTIIEVVLVLAIAGLIFLMVFIALPALQRSQRNTRRRQDMSRVLSAFNDYQANNSGKVPGTSELDDFVNKYINAGGNQGANGTSCEGEEFCDPDGSPYTISQARVFPAKRYDPTGSKVDSIYFNGTGTHDTGPGQSSSDMDHEIYYWPGGKCGSEGWISYTGGANQVAIAYILEGGAIYCGDNQ